MVVSTCHDYWTKPALTINDPYEFKIYGKVTEKGQTRMGWKPMGKSVANIYRYATVSKAANTRCIKNSSD